MKYKADFPKVKNSLLELLNMQNARCCIAMVVPKKHGFVPKTRRPDPNNQEEMKSYYLDTDWVLERNLEYFENHDFLGEALPCIFPFFGTSGHSVYLGSKVDLQVDTIWQKPAYDNLDDIAVDFDKNTNEIFLKQKKLVSELSAEGIGKFLVSMPDNCGSLDALDALYGSEMLLIDLIEQPESVKNALDRIIDVYQDTIADLFDAVRENNFGGSSHSWMHLYSEGKLMQLQCDISVTFSSDMYKDFALHELIRTTEVLDDAIYHLDGREQIRHLDYILSVPKIKMIQWTRVAGQEYTTHFLPVLKRIQDSGRGLVLFPELDEVELLLNELKPQGLMMIPGGVKDRYTADEILRKAGKL